MDTKLQTIEFAQGLMKLRFADGGECRVPLVDFPRLLVASENQRQHWQVIGANRGIYWPEIDEDLSIPALLREYAAPVAPMGEFAVPSLPHRL